MRDLSISCSKKSVTAADTPECQFLTLTSFCQNSDAQSGFIRSKVAIVFIDASILHVVWDNYI